MNFKPEMIDLILAGRKTQTRRPIKPDETECRYKPGRTYSVQPERGKPGVARIEVLSTYRSPLVFMTELCARAEGFKTLFEFEDYWRKLYGSFDPNQMVWVITFIPVTTPTTERR